MNKPIPNHLKPTRNYQCFHEQLRCKVGKDEEDQHGHYIGGCRYWVDDGDIGNCVLRVESPMSQPEIAKAMGVTKQNVIQTEQRALRKIYQIWARHYNGVPLALITKTIKRGKHIDCAV
jgi:hypothetical protein